MSRTATLPAASGQPLAGEPRARVLVAGASGYAGALCARLAWRHPSLELVAATSRSDAGTRLNDLYPQQGQKCCGSSLRL